MPNWNFTGKPADPTHLRDREPERDVLDMPPAIAPTAVMDRFISFYPCSVNAVLVDFHSRGRVADTGSQCGSVSPDGNAGSEDCRDAGLDS
jgi:hypothetical protein